MLNRLLAKVREWVSWAEELLSRPSDVRYTSVPFWKPWRDL